MKYKILLLVAMVVGSICLGQNEPSIPHRYFTSGHLHFDSTGTLIQKQDTVKVLMLVCDTTWDTNEYVEIYDSSTHKIIDKYWIFHASGNIWWQFGYEVREWNSTAIGILYHEPLYFDQNKKPLSKNLVVWLTKEIK